MPPGVEGAVIDARVFARRGVAQDDRTQEIQSLEAERLKQDEGEEIRIIRQETLRKLKRALAGKKLAGPRDVRRAPGAVPEGRCDFAAKNSTICRRRYGASCGSSRRAPPAEIANALVAMNANVEAVQHHYGAKIDRLKAGDELAPGVIKMIKVFVAIKRRLQVGDKMAGRHGNKGVLSRILPRRGYAAHRGRHAGRYRAESAGRAVADERRPDSRDPSGLGGARTRAAGSDRS